METTTPNAGKAASQTNLFYRALKIFGDIRPGEGLTVSLLVRPSKPKPPDSKVFL